MRTHWAVRAAALASIASIAMIARVAYGQGESDIAARRDLLRTAQQASSSGDHARALDLATRAAAISMTPSLRMFIAQEQAAVGRLAEALGSADACMRETERDTTVPNRESIHSTCDGLSRSLQPRVGHVVVHVPNPAPAGLVVTIGGNTLNGAFYGLPYVVSPGNVVVEARAASTEPFHTSVTVSAGANADVNVTLTPVHVEAAQPTPTPTPTPVVAETHDTQPAPAAASSHPLPIAPIVVAGVGVVGLGTSLAMFLLRNSAVDTLNSQCIVASDGTRSCFDNQTAHDALNNANTFGTVSVIALGVGAAALVGGVVWFVVARRSGSQEPAHARRWFDAHPLAGGAAVTFGGEL
jgi:hypothetical protein